MGTINPGRFSNKAADDWAKDRRVGYRQPPRLAIIGDSRGAFHLGASQFSVRGPFNWARYRLMGRLSMDNAWIFAVAGTQIATDNGSGISALSQLPAALAVKPGFLAVISDVNDITNGRTGPQLVADMTTVLSAALAGGVTPILFTCVFPTFWTATQRAHAAYYNNWVRGLKSDPRIIVIDAMVRVVDFASTTAAPIGAGANGYLFDTTHFGPLAAELIGDDIAAALDSRIPTAVWRGMGGIADLYDAALNPAGNLIGANAQLVTGGGALTDSANNAGSAATGSAPAGCRVYKTNGQAIAVASSLVTTTAQANGVNINLPAVRLAISSGGTGRQTAFLRLPDCPVQPNGTRLQSEAFIKVINSAGLYGAALQLVDGNFVQSYADMAAWNNAGVYSFLQNRGRQGIQTTGVMTVTSGAAARNYVQIDVDGATADVIVEIAMPATRIV